MEEIFDKIIQEISINLDKINTDNFLNQIKEIKEINECYDITKEFCNNISDSKNKILLYLSEEKEKLLMNKTQINENMKNTNNDLNKLISNLKSIINQSKLKLKNLTSNINDLNSNLNLITGNLEKKKYSLATSRVEKLFLLKNTMSTNVKSIESLQLKILEEIKSEQIITKKVLNSTSSKIRPNRTPSPFTPTRKNTKSKISNINDKNNLFDKRIKTKRDLSTSMLNIKIRGKSNNIREIRDLNTINVDKRNISRNRGINFEKENEELKKKLSIQKQINDRLTKEINKSKRKSYGNIMSPKINSKISKDKKEIEIKDISSYMKKNILKFNDKINKISDLMFSLTFAINNIQNKKEISTIFEAEFTNIKKYLLSLTTEISELKSCLIKISLDNEKNNNINNISSKKFSENNESSDDIDNSSINQLDNLKKENLNLQNSIDLYKSQIISLNQKLSNEQKTKENIEKNFSNVKTQNNELIEKIYKIEQLNKSASNFNSVNKEEGDTYLKDISTMSYSSEILTLKEELRNSEKKYLELKGMFDSNLESKNLIENLLKKNNEETKRTYEQKILKLKKKLEEKEKEINKLKEYFDKEEKNMLNKIKEDNNENIQKIKSFYENKFISISEQQNNSRLDESNMGKLGKINDELSRIKTADNNDNSINNISLNSFKEQLDDKNEFKNQVADLQNKNNLLEEENNQLKKKMKKMNEEIDGNVETARKSKTQYMNQIFSLQEEILKYKTNENKIKEEILNIEHENRKNKNNIKIYNEELEDMKSLNNKLLKELENLKNEKKESKATNTKEEEEINKLKLENNSYISEINKLKNNIRELNLRKNELEIELNKIKEDNNKIKINKDLEHAQIDKLNNNITLLTIEKEKLESKINELSNKLSKKDKEIILLITNNNKDKKNINEQYKNQIEILKKEVEERKNMNEQYKNQITNLQKKIFQMQNSDNEYDKD